MILWELNLHIFLLTPIFRELEHAWSLKQIRKCTIRILPELKTLLSFAYSSFILLEIWFLLNSSSIELYINPLKILILFILKLLYDWNLLCNVLFAFPCLIKAHAYFRCFRMCFRYVPMSLFMLPFYTLVSCGILWTFTRNGKGSYA